MIKKFATPRRRKKERKQLNRRIEGHRPRLEALEDRAMLTLLGVTPEFPITTYNSTGVVDYDATAQTFDMTAAPLVFLSGPPSPFNLPRPVLPPNGFEVHIEVDNSGNLIGGVAGDDLTLSGTIDIDGDSIPDVSGTLLTGEVTGFGFLDTGSTTDQFDFTFTPTGGAFVAGGTLSGGGTFGPYFDGKDIAVTTSSEASNFVGDFTVDFTGGAKGNIGTTPQAANPGIDITKFINGDDANTAPGVSANLGDTLTFTYEVVNTGNVPLGTVTVTDDNATAGTGDDFNPTFIGGDTDNDGLLDTDETWLYEFVTTATAVGQFTNIAEVVGTPADNDGTPLGIPDVTDDDPANYEVVNPVNPDIDVEKHVCVLEPGDPVMHVVNFDADADGNALPAGTIV
ncbi:MAG: hypothetical protein DWQ31_05040, partial [Planctomycetota bacterium]